MQAVTLQHSPVFKSLVSFIIICHQTGIAVGPGKLSLAAAAAHYEYSCFSGNRYRDATRQSALVIILIFSYCTTKKLNNIQSDSFRTSDQSTIDKSQHNLLFYTYIFLIVPRQPKTACDDVNARSSTSSRAKVVQTNFYSDPNCSKRVKARVQSRGSRTNNYYSNNFHESIIAAFYFFITSPVTFQIGHQSRRMLFL